MKNRLFVLLVSLLCIGTLLAATNTFSAADKFFKKYRGLDGGGESPSATYARALLESPAANGSIQVYDTNTLTVRDINATELPTFIGVATASLTSAAAATAVNLVPDSAVPSGKKCYLLNYYVKIGGATDWATTSTVKIQDTNGTPVDFTTLTASTLDGNEFHGVFSDSATIAAAMYNGTGGTAGKGIQVVGDANGTGSTLALTVVYAIK